MNINLVLLREVIPESERENSQALKRTLYLFEELIEDYAAALELYNSLEAEFFACHHRLVNRQDRMVIPPHELELSAKLSRRMKICTRDSAVSMGNLNEIFEKGLGRGLKKCGLIASLVDDAALERAQQKFNAHFPDAKWSRHAIAHRGVPSENAAESRKHALKEAYLTDQVEIGAGNFFTEVGRVTKTNWKGDLVEHSLTEDSLRKLREILEDIHAAFEPVASGIWEKFYSQTGRQKPPSQVADKATCELNFFGR